MGWQDRHLHRFRVGAPTFGDRGRLGEVSARGERTARLIEVASAPADRLRYEYDFGDRWEHDVVVEAVLPPATDATSTISWVVLNDGLVSSPAWVINRVLVSRRHACAVPNSHASPMPTQSSAPARGMH
jgi:hypothetical protein